MAQSSSRPKVSLCLIARNEAKSIPACLNSVRKDVDEIIVVDTGSTDGTKRVAKRHGARVADFVWRDDFAAARNFSIEQARGEWILVLDCDERLAPESWGRVRQAAESLQSTAAYVRIVNIDARGEQAGAWQAIRMFRKAAGVRYCGRIHERPVFPEAPDGEGGQPEAPGVTLLHHGYQAAALKARDKASRNLRLVEKALSETPDDDVGQRSFYLFYYAFGSPVVQRAERIEEWARFVESAAGLEQTPSYPWVPVGLAQYAWWLSDRRRHAEAEVRARRLAARYGPSPQLYLVTANARAAAGDYAAAEEAIELLLDPDLEIAPPYAYFALDVDLVRRRARHLRAEIAERHGRLERAAEIYGELVRIEPGHLPSVLRLSLVRVQQQRYEEALGVIKNHPELFEQGLAEIDCLCLALSLMVNSADQGKWRNRVQNWLPKSDIAARVWEQLETHGPGAGWALSDFPELEQGLKVPLP